MTAMPAEWTVDGRAVPVLLRRHPGARRIVMRLSPCRTAIKLTVPAGTSSDTVRSFLERHENWAAERLAEPLGRAVADGSAIPFRGGLLHIRHDPARRSTVLDGDRLLVGGESEHLPRRVKDFLVRAARADLETAVTRHAAAVGIRPAGMTLKDTVSRWGSCSAGRRLSFSWRIVMAPSFALDYLAAHEVAHLREMNHGPDFWALCRELCPGMDKGRSWLKRHGGSLHAVQFDAKRPDALTGRAPAR